MSLRSSATNSWKTPITRQTGCTVTSAPHPTPWPITKCSRHPKPRTKTETPIGTTQVLRNSVSVWPFVFGVMRSEPQIKSPFIWLTDSPPGVTASRGKCNLRAPVNRMPYAFAPVSCATMDSGRNRPARGAVPRPQQRGDSRNNGPHPGKRQSAGSLERVPQITGLQVQGQIRTPAPQAGRMYSEPLAGYWTVIKKTRLQIANKGRTELPRPSFVFTVLLSESQSPGKTRFFTPARKSRSRFLKTFSKNCQKMPVRKYSEH